MVGDSLVGLAGMGWAWGTVREGLGAPVLGAIGLMAPPVPGAQGKANPGKIVPVLHEGDPIRLGPSMYIEAYPGSCCGTQAVFGLGSS